MVVVEPANPGHQRDPERNRQQQWGVRRLVKGKLAQGQQQCNDDADAAPARRGLRVRASLAGGIEQRMPQRIATGEPGADRTDGEMREAPCEKSGLRAHDQTTA